MLTTKEKINAPCWFINDKGEKKWPAVDCALVCETCPWNPAEAERRKKEGRIVAVVQRLEFPKRRWN